MDILFIASDYKPLPGGIAAFIDSLAKGLRRLGDSVRVLAVVPAEEREQIAFLQHYASWVRALPIVFDERPKNRFANKFVSLLEIGRCLAPGARSLWERTPFFRSSRGPLDKFETILAEEKPSVVVFGHLDRRLYPFASVLRKRRLPYGILAHDVEVYRSGYKVNDVIIRGIMLKGARWIVANSQHTRELLKGWGIPEERKIIIHPPISEELIRASCNSGEKPDGSDYRLISICRLVKSKGIDVALHALKFLDQKGIPFTYQIAGAGKERENLEWLAGALNLRKKVRFLGFIEDDQKPALIRNADVFVMASRVKTKDHHEGFGIGFMEAAAFGVPGVGSRAGGIPDAVVHGRTGLLVPQESSQDLAQALISLYENPLKRKEMGKRAMARALNEFSPVAIAASFQKEVYNILQGDG